MLSLPLNPKKLLGFKLVAVHGVDARVAISIKLGSKVGSKVGTKVINPTRRR